MSFIKVFFVATFVILLILGAFYYYFYWGMWSSLGVAEKSVIAQIYFGTTTLVAVVITLLYATVQFRRMVASPQLKVVVDQGGSTRTDISIPKSLLNAAQDYEQQFNLYIYNDGNLVADLYNVEFKLPSIFKPVFQTADTDLYGVQRITGITEDSLSIIHFYSRRADEYVCYVHKLVNIGVMILKITPDNKDKLPYNFQIGYHIFGSWAAKQEGSIDVSLNVE